MKNLLLSLTISLLDSDEPIFDVDTHPTVLQTAIPTGTLFMYPLNTVKTIAIVPKNYRFKNNLCLTSYNALLSWKDRYGGLFLLYFIILFIISRICLVFIKHDHTSEFETSNLLLCCAGIVGCYVIAPLKNKQLQYVTISMTIPAMMVYNVYSGVMYDLFNFQPSGDINSLSELVSSDLWIATDRATWTLLENIVTDATVSMIINRVEIFKSKQEMMDQVTNNRQTALIRSQFQAELMVRSICDSKGYDLFHIIPRSVHQCYQAMVGRRDFPLLWKIDELTARMIEAGVVQHEWALLYFHIHLELLARVKRGQLSEPEPRAINFDDLMDHFRRVKGGFICCALVCGLEVLYHKYGPGVIRFVQLFLRNCLARLKDGCNKLRSASICIWKKIKTILMKH